MEDRSDSRFVSLLKKAARGRCFSSGTSVTLFALLIPAYIVCSDKLGWINTHTRACVFSYVLSSSYELQTLTLFAEKELLRVKLFCSFM